MRAYSSGEITFACWLVGMTVWAVLLLWNAVDRWLDKKKTN